MKLISVKSVLYDLSLTIDPSRWNEAAAIEWAIKASRKIGTVKMYIQKERFFNIQNSKLELPDNLVEIKSLFSYSPTLNNTHGFNQSLLGHHSTESGIINSQVWIDRVNDIWINQRNQWTKVYLDLANFMSPCLRNGRKQCFPLYKQNGNTIQFNFEEGTVAMSYIAYAEDGKGEYMIPDDEDFKEAIVAYILYRLADAASFNEYSKENVEQRMYYLQRYSVLAAKAKGRINEPTEDQLVAIGNYRNSMLPSKNASLFDYSQTFLPEQSM